MVAGMPFTCRTRARTRPPRPAPTMVTGVVMAAPFGMVWNDVPYTPIGTSFQSCQDKDMTTESPRTERRADALSKARIVEAAIGLLDEGGESALTFRALAGRLATGS